VDKPTFLAAITHAVARANTARQSVANLTLDGDEAQESDKRAGAAAKSLYIDRRLLDALQEIAEPLANSYLQIVADFEDDGRISWAGTAHEIRELLRKLLEQLAPVDKVEAEPWFKQEANTSGPTQRQRVKYILASQNGDSKQQKVAQDIELIEDKIGMLVRDVYGRASDAAHRSKSKAEAFKILRYFHAFAYDLLDIN
jgi:hypothetical protein